jgi:N-acetylmuramic acid 6-phosphate etherase
MLTTAAFIRLGYVYGNLMVNVQPTNAKLVDRACRIVAQATGLNAAASAEWLARAGNRVPLAIVMAKNGLSPEEAERRLAASGGRITPALRDSPG